MCRLQNARRAVHSTLFPPYTYLKSYIDYCADLEHCPVFTEQRAPHAAAAAALEVRKARKAREEIEAAVGDEEKGPIFERHDEEGLEVVVGSPVEFLARGTMAESKFARPRRRRA
ncbi:hypothetical protein MMC11_007107 [Xylographa trunciseda]|nr:hypothetical protein [Xylographa trunciseda]